MEGNANFMITGAAYVSAETFKGELRRTRNAGVQNGFYSFVEDVTHLIPPIRG